VSILDRLNLLMRSEISGRRRSGSDPEAELRGTFTEAKASLARIMHLERTLNRDYQLALDAVQRFEDAAVASLQRGDEPGARAQLMEKQRAERRANAARTRLDEVRREYDDLSAALDALQMRFEAGRDRAGSTAPPLHVRPNPYGSTSAYASPHAHTPPYTPPQHAPRRNPYAASVEASPTPAIPPNPYLPSTPSASGPVYGHASSYQPGSHLRSRDFPTSERSAPPPHTTGRPYDARDLEIGAAFGTEGTLQTMDRFDEMASRIQGLEAATGANRYLDAMGRVPDDPLYDDTSARFQELERENLRRRVAAMSQVTEPRSDTSTPSSPEPPQDGDPLSRLRRRMGSDDEA